MHTNFSYLFANKFHFLPHEKFYVNYLFFGYRWQLLALMIVKLNMKMKINNS
jgi:hypothetical protein